MAQSTADSLQALTLDEAIRSSLKNHPSMQKADLQIEEQKALRSTAWDFDKTSIFHQREETNGSELQGVVSYGVQQNFDFPTTYLRKLQYQQEKVDQSLQYKDISANELIAQTSIAYNNWLLAWSKLALIRRQDSIFRGFESAARLRFDTGETGKLEMLSATSQAKKVAVMLEQAQAEYEAATETLKSWLNTDKDITPGPDSLYRFNEALLTTGGDLASNPVVAFYSQNRSVAEAAFKVQRSQFLPEINLGYSDQTINERSGFYMYRIGLNVPLLFFAQKGRTQAARIRQSVAEKEYREQELILDRQYAVARAALEKAVVSLRFYENEGIELAEEQIRTAHFGYKLGEVDYIAFIQNMGQALDLRSDYLNSLSKYNLAVIELNRLSGKQLEKYDLSGNR